MIIFFFFWTQTKTNTFNIFQVSTVHFNQIKNIILPSLSLKHNKQISSQET